MRLSIAFTAALSLGASLRAPADAAHPVAGWFGRAAEVESSMDNGAHVQEPGDTKQLAKLAHQLASADAQEQTAALEKLARLLAASKGDEAAFMPVIEPLFQRAGWGGIARNQARMAENLIVRIGRPALPLVHQRMKSADAHDRRVAAELVVRIAPRDAALAALLRPLVADRDNFVRQAAIHGLGVIGPQAEEAIGDLERAATNDPNLDRRVGARIALIRVAGASEERVRALAAFLEMKDERMKDERKLESKGDTKQSTKDAAVYAASALRELGPIAKAAEVQLVAALKNSELRFTAAATLGEIGSNSQDAVSVLIDLLKNAPTNESRRSAAGALGAFGPAAKTAIPALGEALKGDGKAGWWVAADSLSKIGGAEVVPVLIEALTHPNEGIRLTSMRGLGNLGSLAKPAVVELEKARKQELSERNRMAATEALRKIELAGKK